MLLFRVVVQIEISILKIILRNRKQTISIESDCLIEALIDPVFVSRFSVSRSGPILSGTKIEQSEPESNTLNSSVHLKQKIRCP